MPRNDRLYQQALDAINKLFSDTSVSKNETRSNLQALRDEIDLLLDALGTD